MKKLSSIFLLIILSAFYISCSPLADTDGDLLFGTTNSPASINISKQLKSVTIADSSGTNLIYTYFYNAGKLTDINTNDNSISYKLFYENNLLSNISIIEDDGSLTTTNFIITYNNGKFNGAQGLGIQDNGNSFANTITATYANNKVSTILSKVKGIDSSDPTISYDINTIQNDLTYIGNNVSTSKITTSFPLPIPDIVVSTTFTDFDDKKNPFKNLPEAFSIINSVYGNSAGSINGFSINNCRSATAVALGGSTSAAYVYTYDSEGYPTRAVSPFETLIFEYQ